MPNYIVTGSELTAVADAIRAKTGEEGLLEWPAAFSSAIADITTGSGPELERSDVNYYDIDGKLIAAYTKAQWLDANFTDPAVPTVEGLIGGSWGYTVANKANYLTEYLKLDIGAQYTAHTDLPNGGVKLVIDTDVYDGCLGITIAGNSLAPVTNVVIDWGDENFTYLNRTLTEQLYTHTFNNPGRYEILITGTNLKFGRTNGNLGIVSMGEYFLKEAYFFQNMTMPTYLFKNCINLERVVFGKNVQITLSSNTLYRSGPKFIMIPVGTTISASFVFEESTYLEHIIFHPDMSNINSSSLFTNCYNLKTITQLPLNSFGSCLFQNCRQLEEVIIPKSFSEVGNSSLQGCVSLNKIYIPYTSAAVELSGAEPANAMYTLYVPLSKVFEYVPEESGAAVDIEPLDGIKFYVNDAPEYSALNATWRTWGNSNFLDDAFDVVDSEIWGIEDANGYIIHRYNDYDTRWYPIESAETINAHERYLLINNLWDSGITMANFTLEGNKEIAENGMVWDDWRYTPYNKNEIIFDYNSEDYFLVSSTDSTQALLDSANYYQMGDMPIYDGESYRFRPIASGHTSQGY